jgi:hypothetical protein
MRSIAAIVIITGLAALVAGPGCAKTPKYGTEWRLNLPQGQQSVWAVAPAINLSGQPNVDPLLQADLLYQQLQQVGGLTVVPVNRVADIYASLGLTKVQSVEQATLVCDLLGVEALVVPTITIYDPYDPPKVGAALQVFIRPGAYQRANTIDPHTLARRASPGEAESLPQNPDFEQTVGMFDAANGTVRQRLWDYARGRNNPTGPLGRKEYLMSMDRYCGFVYHELIEALIASPRLTKPTASEPTQAGQQGG